MKPETTKAAEAYESIFEKVLEYQPCADRAETLQNANWVRCIVSECFSNRDEIRRLQSLLQEHKIDYFKE